MRRSFAFLLATALVIPSALAQAPAQPSTTTPPYRNPALSPAERARDLVHRMSLDEKAAQSVNTAPAIPRLGVPAYDYWSEGLHGIARSGYATLFPQAIGMAATWDAPLFNTFGTVVSTEARAKFNEALRHDLHSIYFGLTIWSPNINIFRDPRWGRGQETYGEDPVLTATLADQFVRGLQGTDPTYFRTIATPKHFAVHSGPESERHRFNVDPSPHDLWDTYLPAFRKTIVDAHADSIMCAYNSVDGKPACASDLLLQQVLRADWKFQGFVTSDCGAVDDFYMKTAHQYSPDAEHAAATSILAGTDTNCGDTYLALPAAIKAGLLSESDLDRTLTRLFEARIRLGLFDPPDAVPYNKIPFSENRASAHLAASLRAAEEAMVLLKNDGILPLAPGKYRTIAVVGPNAASLAAIEGNYNAIPKDPRLPVDALADAMPGAKILYAEGSPYANGLALPVPRTMFHPDANSAAEGLHAEYFAGSSFAGHPVLRRIDPEIDFDWNAASPAPGVPATDFSVRWTGVLVPLQPGPQSFAVDLSHCYPCNDEEQVEIKLDGKVVDTIHSPAKPGRGSTTPAFTLSFADTAPHPIEITYHHSAPVFGAGLSLLWTPPPNLLQQQAAATAAKADLTIAMVGLSPNLEGEEMPIHVEGFAGGDRTDIKLPAAQQQLLEAVAASGKPLLVVLLNGSALAVNWPAEHANALLEAWYPGEFGGKAIAETLTGRNNPAGRLPVTFYASLDELPPFTDYNMRNRTYRYFTGQPLYPFGFGLSYTRFAYAHLKLSTTQLKAGDPLTAEVDVTNTGALPGEEVAELYLLPPTDGNGGLSPGQANLNPRLALAGFERLSLQPGQTRHLTFALDPRRLSLVDAAGNRAVQPGAYTLSVGGSQPSTPSAPHAVTPVQTASFTITGTAHIPH